MMMSINRFSFFFFFFLFCFVKLATPAVVIQDATVDVNDSDVPGNKAEVSGTLTRDDGAVFFYEGIKKQSKQIVELKETTAGGGAAAGDYTRFILENLNNDHIIIEVFQRGVTNGASGKDKKYKMKIKPHADPHLDADNTKILEEMAAGKLGQTFVAASEFLGTKKDVKGYNNAAALAFHTMAIWMAKMGTDGSTGSGAKKKPAADDGSEQRLLQEEEEKATDGSSFEKDVVGTHGRHLACEKKNCCGNGCFGMCGAGCSCWDWHCGSCDCFNECNEHDYYCSCESMLHFWCVNVFWVGCGNSGWVDHCPWWG